MIVIIGGILVYRADNKSGLYIPVARYKEHAGDPRATPQNSNCNKLYSRHVPVVGVSVVCAVPNGTFIALAPRTLHLAEFRHPQFIAFLRFSYFFWRVVFCSSGDIYNIYYTYIIYRIFIKFLKNIKNVCEYFV